MLEKIIKIDEQLLVYLNQLGTPTYDDTMLHLTNQLNWWPLFIIIIYLLLKKINFKTFILLIFILTLFFVFTDQSTNFFKNTYQRLRPVNNNELIPYLRIIKSSNSFSFFSGHASNSSGAILFIYLILRTNYKYSWVLFIFPLFFAYTRIYLGLHFPLDIIAGYLFGLSSGYLFYSIYKSIIYKYKTFQSLK